jgi:hypothetical protein
LVYAYRAFTDATLEISTLQASGCPDDDGDGVCNDVDACPGFDDTLDDDGDGVPDDCDPCPVDNPDDTDGDGICDSDDICPDGDDTIDTDGDGVPDFCDICEGGNDAADGDGDGVPDFCDTCPLDNPDDTDGDGVCDSDDICAGGDDTIDTDSDGVPDGCDACPLDNPDDTDLDGVCDSTDPCPLDNPDDTDLDGVCDSADPCPFDNPDDTDGDGVCDSADPCPLDNPDDTDGDGVCDSADPCPLDNPDDTDSDGVCDIDDICPGGNDAVDGDLDGVPDACDLCPSGDDNADADGDGIADACDACEGSDDTLDADVDGVPDGCDICPAGDDNLDADTDTVPDACDICPGGDDLVDGDVDGVPDDCDICPAGDDNVDTDGDGFPNACDDCPSTWGDGTDGCPTGPSAESGQVTASTAYPVTVSLQHTYASMVGVLTVVYDNRDVPPMVARMVPNDTTGSSFDLYLERVDNGSGPLAATVHYIVVEEGQHEGFEAWRMDSTTTQNRRSWNNTASVGYANNYSNPVVIGQVMSHNDPDWSVFWANGGFRGTPPTASTLAIGKHVAEDPDTYRVNETLGWIVFESGTTTVAGQDFTAGLSADFVLGTDNGGPYTIGLPGTLPASTAVLSSAAMDGSNGGWPVLLGTNPVTSDYVNVVYDEDQLRDSERSHITEQVAYVVAHE